ncbi:hypothetical protein WJX74_004915 [Apatococcus lobatus]|uniref:Methyltransferase type 11 domain-containing protein n=1 Tax=Apatococcus lobatus TaxID=904363 RepID=A0AAW1QM83_9CHLO
MNSADTWNRGAKAYQRHIKGSAPLGPVYQHFATDVAAHLQATCTEPYRVLDVASATGEPAFTLADTLAGVHVTVTDIAETMVELAEKEGCDRNIRNASFQVANGEDLSAWSDGTFDAVMCASAIFMMDAARALGEWKRVLKPGGYVAFSTWQLGEKHQLSGLVGATMARITPGTRPPLPTQDLTKPEPVEALLQAAGFEDIHYRDMNVPMHLSPSEVEDLTENPMFSIWIEKNAPAGPEREAFSACALKTLRAVAHERSYLKDDGCLTCPVQGLLYFTALKP